MQNKTIDERLVESLKELHLPTIRKTYKRQGEAAIKESLSYEEYLLDILEKELDVRRENKTNRLLRESKLPLEKTISSFERKRLPSKLDMQINSLMDGSFLNRKENILAFGNPGSGKTHLLCAIANEIIHHRRSVIFKPCNILVQELLLAKKEFRLPKMLRQLSKYELIMIDDIGYVEQNREEMEVLFTLLADRYERGSIMLTSNLPFSKWEQIFKDPMTTAAAIDRLVHHSIILELNLPSYRLEESKKQKVKPDE